MTSKSPLVTRTMMLVCASGLLGTAAALAQQPVGGGVAAAQFEVASVRPNNSGSQRSSSAVQPGGRYIATNATLRDLVRSAYGVRDGQIVGGPSWIADTRFDVVARAAGNPVPGEFREAVRPMLRQLLTDRFALKAHREMRVLPVYALRVARSDGRLGAQLKPADQACAAAPAVGAAPPTAVALQSPPCGSGFNRRGWNSGRAVPFSTLASSLSDWVDRIIVDETKLSGMFDWDLKWDPDATPDRRSTAAAGAPNSGTTDGVSMFTALREQLGLTLESTQAAVEALIVDSAALPTPD